MMANEFRARLVAQHSGRQRAERAGEDVFRGSGVHRRFLGEYLDQALDGARLRIVGRLAYFATQPEWPAEVLTSR